MAQLSDIDAYELLERFLEICIKEGKTGEEVKKSVKNSEVEFIAMTIESKLDVAEFRAIQQDLLEEGTSLENIINNPCLFWVKCKLRDFDWDEWFKGVQERG
jgi:hypothetical protein